MNIAIYTLTRDRLEFTQRAFGSLRDKAGVQFKHYVWDNGSADDTPNWLKWHYRPHWMYLSKCNVGIAKAANSTLNTVFSDGNPDVVCKVDNDCEVVSDNILVGLCEVLAATKNMAVSPRVEGLRQQPERKETRDIAGHKVGITHIIGGLFHCAPGEIYKRFRYHEKTPRGAYNDSYFCNWCRKEGIKVGYVEDLVVRHMDTTDGQIKQYPEYFERKETELQHDLKEGFGKQEA